MINEIKKSIIQSKLACALVRCSNSTHKHVIIKFLVYFSPLKVP